MEQQPAAATGVAGPSKQPETFAEENNKDRLYCAIKLRPTPVFREGMSGEHAIIVVGDKKRWLNGTVLHYYFYNDPDEGSDIEMSDGTTEWRTWAGAPAQQDIVREAFAKWKAIGIGLEFQEVATREPAEIRIGFQLGGGSWSSVGREDILDVKDPHQRTMNFGWDLDDPNDVENYGRDTALHEIGHSLGLLHEHQSPFSGLEWDEIAVYAYFGLGTRNNWCPKRIKDNILTPADPGSVTGSAWDVNSVMEYRFDPGLVRKPKPYDTNGIKPAGGLSKLDKAWVSRVYPPLAPVKDELHLAQMQPLNVANGVQRNFIIEPQNSGHYTVEASGKGDTVMALFENNDGAFRYVRGDDDSGETRSAKLQVHLQKGQQYVLRAKQVYNADLTNPVELALRMQ